MVFKDSSYQLSGKQNLALIKAQNKKNSFLSTKFTAGVCFFFFFFLLFLGGHFVHVYVSQMYVTRRNQKTLIFTLFFPSLPFL